ncbi:hypothetical protein [Pseudomonas sp. SJZ079]|uniref:hypothetical protein n=1 Tax=Pseudomonas sp. SJZ079 TaxID=2572887 RepID=UPI0011BD6662|nr:hypothetical protein [Pseudomonas sp. SJZ079]
MFVLARDGAIVLNEQVTADEALLLFAIGGYQLAGMRRAAVRLSVAGCAWRLIYLQEPGRFRAPRDRCEADASGRGSRAQCAASRAVQTPCIAHSCACGSDTGHLWPILGEARNNRGLGYRNQGGALNEAGLLFANRANWASVLEASAQLLSLPLGDLLAEHERAALTGHGDPACQY